MEWSFRSVSRVDESWRCDRLVVKQARRCLLSGSATEPADARPGSTAVRTPAYCNVGFGPPCAPEGTGSSRPACAAATGRYIAAAKTPIVTTTNPVRRCVSPAVDCVIARSPLAPGLVLGLPKMGGDNAPLARSGLR
jgi:hypothetical protein